MTALPWWPIAQSQIGVTEIPGRPADPRIQAYLASTTIGADLTAQDETPWCSAFVNWCVQEAGAKGTGSAWARSWLKWGQPWDGWKRWGGQQPVITTPPLGAIVVLSRGDGGHVGFFGSLKWEYPLGRLEAEPDVGVWLLGGNQGNAVKNSLYPASRLLGIRVP